MAITISQALYTLVPGAEWSLKDSKDYSTIEWLSPNIPQPTAEQIQAEIARLENQAPLDACKAQAKRLLLDTDWSELPSVSDPANTPHLVNQSDFIAYRTTVRLFAVNPVVNPSFPPVPVAQWG